MPFKDVASARKSTFATKQPLWRLLNNESITSSQPNQPLIEPARHSIASSPHSYALVVHDWSRLQFHSHHKKHGSLLVDASSALSVAQLAQRLTAKVVVQR